MNIVMKNSLSRRTVLRGLGASLALPFLDSMVPAFAGAAPSVPKRLGAFYAPNGMSMKYWTPQSLEPGFELPPILAPLEPFRHNLYVLSHLANSVGIGDGVGGHARSCGPWLTASRIKKTEGLDIRAGISMDQVAAKHLGQDTQLSSLELSVDSNDTLGACDSGYSCAYTNTISWRDERTPMPMESDPRAVFERLFGAAESTDAEARMARLAQERSVLDLARESLSRLKKTLGPQDQLRLSQYLDGVRETERRIQTAESQSQREIPVVERPGAAPDSYEKHAQLMLDLMALAFQTDLTRVGTFMTAKEQTGRSYPEIGVPDGHHPVSHHQNDPVKLEKLAKINIFHMQQFAYLLDKLRNTPEGDGSVLDNSIFVYGSGMSDGNLHFQLDLPTLIVGGIAGKAKGGRHLAYKNDTPVANLWVAMLDKVGVPVDKFGDSTGKLDYLSGI